MLNQPGSSGPTTPTRMEPVKENGKKIENNNSIPPSKIQNNTGVGPDLISPPKPKRVGTDTKQIPNGHVESNGFKSNKQNMANLSDNISIDESWALELDLGTSLMDDVMGIMDKVEL